MWPWLVVGLGLVLVYNSIVYVHPNSRDVFYDYILLKWYTRGPGFHLVPFWSLAEVGPFLGLFTRPPLPNITAQIDPPPTQIVSSDGVSGTANVCIKIKVKEWEAEEVMRVLVPFIQTAHTICNQWLAAELVELKAEILCNYSKIDTLLNLPDALGRLNFRLKEVYMEALSVSIDSDGLQMDPSYLDSVKKRRIADCEVERIQKLMMAGVKDIGEYEKSLALMEAAHKTEKLQITPSFFGAADQ
jgi:hypothetical protein